MRRSATNALGALLVLACASADPPPGGERDVSPPRVLSVTPEAMSTLDSLEDDVVFRFDERISERGIEQAVRVSPLTGDFEVDRGRREIRVRQVGGWTPGTVYRVTLLPVIQDLFGNVREQPAELVFSTGPEIPETAIAGLVRDRLTGQEVQEATVQALRLPDSLPYVAMSDTAGFFALRHIPAGEYHVQAFTDSDADRELDPFEPRDTASANVGEADTLVLELALLPTDTTPAVLARAEAIDSLAVRLLFDDFLAPEDPLEDVVVELRELPDSTRIPVDTVLHAHEWEEIRAEEAAAREEALAEELEAEDPEAVEDVDAEDRDPEDAADDEDDEPEVAPEVEPAPELEAAPAADQQAAAAGPPLPTRELIVVPALRLEPGVTYLVRIAGVENISGVPGGGGTVEFMGPEPPEPEPEPEQEPEAQQ